MTDAERLALAKRLYDAEQMNLGRYKAGMKSAENVDVCNALANMVDIARAKLSTMRALFPELMEDEG